MCGEGREEGGQKIFINSGGEFRRRIKSRPHCLSQQTDCVKILEEYFSSSREKKYKYDERAEVSCRKESFNNLDSGSDLQCSWRGRPGLEQAQCLERKHNYRPHTFTASQIVCCRADTSTVFNPRAASAAGAGLPLCSEGHLNQCKQEWTDWSGWEVSALLQNIPGWLLQKYFASGVQLGASQVPEQVPVLLLLSGGGNGIQKYWAEQVQSCCGKVLWLSSSKTE